MSLKSSNKTDVNTTELVITIDAAAFEASYGGTEKALMVKHDIYTSCDK